MPFIKYYRPVKNGEAIEGGTQWSLYPAPLLSRHSIPCTRQESHERNELICPVGQKHLPEMFTGRYKRILRLAVPANREVPNAGGFQSGVSRLAAGFLSGVHFIVEAHINFPLC
jgi:hypothetical protein